MNQPNQLDDWNAWAEVLFGAVSKSEVLENVDKRIVDVVCATCNERVGAVLEERDGLRLVMWGPWLSGGRDHAGEPLMSVRNGKLPSDDVEILAHCLHGAHLTITGRELRTAVEKYRKRGFRVRAPMTISTDRTTLG